MAECGLAEIQFPQDACTFFFAEYGLPDFTLVLRGGDGLGERDEVAAGILYGKFLHPIKRSSHGHDHTHVLHGGKDGVEIVRRGDPPRKGSAAQFP